MSQSVLSIDLSINPGLLLHLAVDADRLTVVDQRSFQIPEIPSGGAAEGEPAAAENPGLSLRQALQELGGEFESSVAFVAPDDYLSLQLQLPFADQKSIAKVLELEVQDLIPFDISDFVIQHQVIGPHNGSGHLVHVGVMPRTRIKHVLDVCRTAGLEPLVLCTASSALAVLSQMLPKEGLPLNYAIVALRSGSCHIVNIVGGKVHSDRTINLKLLSPDPQLQLPALVREVLISIAPHAEDPAAHGPEAIFTLGELPWADDLARASGLPVRSIDVAQIGNGLDAHTVIPSLGANFIREKEPVPALTNFRVNEFRYRPQLAELRKGLIKLMPYFLATLLLGIVAFGAIYYSRALYLSQLRSTMVDEIHKAVPGLELPAGREIGGLIDEINKIDAQLSSLGSPARLTPLHALSELSRYLPSSAGISVRRIGFRANKVTFEGEVTEYAAMDRLERVFERSKKKKRIICDYKRGNASGGGMYGGQATKPFSFELTLCD
ncbi:MAG: hypothetical protein K1X83_04755 [Oligoflexia bacterium]|nr:hypothetical protein [Oligoflexia bacterium]